MRTVNAIIGCILLALAILHAFIPHSSASALTFILLYAAGAACAFASMRTTMGLFLARVFAVGTTSIMFVYFAGFFSMATHFNEGWYRSGAALEGIGMLLSAFAMIPILSAFSCMLKADCRESMQQRHASRAAFFSVPDGVQEEAR